MLEEITKVVLLLLPPVFMVLNAERGADDGIKRWQFGLGILVSVFITFIFAGIKLDHSLITTLRTFKESLILSGKCAASFALFGFWWSVWGWGRYFTAGHGDIRVWNFEKDDPFVDFIVDRIFGRNLKTQEEARTAGIVAMNLRAWSFYPAFFAVAYFTGNIWPAIVGLGVFLQGVFYYIGWLIFGLTFIHPTEKMFGFYLGGLIALTGAIIL